MLRNSQYTNGLAVDRAGRLIACQGRAGRLITIDPATGAIGVLAAGLGGKRFNEPNDLAVDVLGGVWFTDPQYRTEPPPQGVEGVYYVAPTGAVTRVLSGLAHPNGIALSPDEKTLYVTSDGTVSSLRAYDVLGPGRLGSGRELARWTTGRIDGMAIDSSGNLYVTRPLAYRIEVLSPSGKALGSIRVPYYPANVTFAGPDAHTLIVAARATILAAPMAVAGHRPAWLEVSATSVPTMGGRIALTVRGLPSQAGRDYAVLMGASGTYPGLTIDGLRVPLEFDDLIVAVLAAANTGPFQGFLGRLDPSGAGRATLALPPLDPSLAGLELDFAGVLTNPVDRATNARKIVLTR